MKKILLFTSVLFISIIVFSQDIILLKNGKRREVIVTEITPTLVRFKLSHDSNERGYFMYKDDVESIQYQDGRVKSLSQLNEQKTENISSIDEKRNQNLYQNLYQNQAQSQLSSNTTRNQDNYVTNRQSTNNRNQSDDLATQKNSTGRSIWNSPSVHERKVEYQDGVAYQFYVNNGLTVALSNTSIKHYGKWHRVYIVIQNDTSEPIEFDPACVTAFSTDKRNRISKLEVWPYEKFIKKVKRSQTWSAIAMGLAEGLAVAGAGYSTSHTNTNTYYSGNRSSYGTASAYGSGGYAYGTYSGNSNYRGSAQTNSVTRTYDGTAAYYAQAMSQNRMAAFDESQWNVRNVIQAGYLKRNTIYPGNAVAGYMNIQRKNWNTVSITLNVNGVDYTFDWLYGK